MIETSGEGGSAWLTPPLGGINSSLKERENVWIGSSDYVAHAHNGSQCSLTIIRHHNFFYECEAAEAGKYIVHIKCVCVFFLKILMKCL